MPVETAEGVSFDMLILKVCCRKHADLPRNPFLSACMFCLVGYAGNALAAVKRLRPAMPASSESRLPALMDVYAEDMVSVVVSLLANRTQFYMLYEYALVPHRSCQQHRSIICRAASTPTCLTPDRCLMVSALHTVEPLSS